MLCTCTYTCPCLSACMPNILFLLFSLPNNYTTPHWIWIFTLFVCHFIYFYLAILLAHSYLSFVFLLRRTDDTCTYTVSLPVLLSYLRCFLSYNSVKIHLGVVLIPCSCLGLFLVQPPFHAHPIYSCEQSMSGLFFSSSLFQLSCCLFRSTSLPTSCTGFLLHIFIGFLLLTVKLDAFSHIFTCYNIQNFLYQFIYCSILYIFIIAVYLLLYFICVIVFYFYFVCMSFYIFLPSYFTSSFLFVFCVFITKN